MSLLKQLRNLMPARPLTFEEARWVAERQAGRLRELSGYTNDAFLPREAIDSLPKIEVIYDPELRQSGSSHWNGRRWQITINGSEPFTRQRYTLAHEYKHIVDFPFDDFCYPASGGKSPEQLAETICDYFAACLLMPKMLIRRAWTAGASNQDAAELARLFGVSPRAMEIRLQDLGLLEARYRCRFPGPSRRPRRTYYRSSVPTRALLTTGI